MTRPLPLSSMTDAEKAQIRAYLRSGSFQEAARRCGFHRQTVAQTWHRWRPTFCQFLPSDEATFRHGDGSPSPPRA
jgi:hypothetical protein